MPFLQSLIAFFEWNFAALKQSPMSAVIDFEYSHFLFQIVKMPNINAITYHKLVYEFVV